MQQNGACSTRWYFLLRTTRIDFAIPFAAILCASLLPLEDTGGTTIIPQPAASPVAMASNVMDVIVSFFFFEILKCSIKISLRVYSCWQSSTAESGKQTKANSSYGIRGQNMEHDEQLDYIDSQISAENLIYSLLLLDLHLSPRAALPIHSSANDGGDQI